MKTKFKHKEIKWLSIHHIDAINHYIKKGWIVKSIHYLDHDFPKGNRIVKVGYWSDSVRVKLSMAVDCSAKNNGA